MPKTLWYVNVFVEGCAHVCYVSPKTAKMCNCMFLDVTAICFGITAFLTTLPFLAKGLMTSSTNTILQLKKPGFFLGVTKKEKIRNEHIRGTLKVDRFVQKAKMVRSYKTSGC